MRRTSVRTANKRNLLTQDRLDQDHYLIQNILTDDPVAAERFTYRFRRLIFAIVLSQGHPMDDAEDIYQEIYVHLWDGNRRRLRDWRGGDGRQFRYFLSTLTARVAMDYRRRRDRRHIHVSDCDLNSGYYLDLRAQGHDFMTVLETNQQALAIKDAMTRLSPQDAELIRRRHVLQESYADIGEALGLTANHVGVALMRAESRVRRDLEKTFPDLFESPSKSKKPI